MKGLGLLIDRMSTKAIWLLGVAYYVLFFICVIVGVTGPAAIVRNISPPRRQQCVGDCSPTWDTSVRSLSPRNQFLSVWGQFSRPSLRDGSPAAINQDVSFDLGYTTSVTGDFGAVRTVNTTHTTSIQCAAGLPFCAPFVVVWEPEILMNNYTVTITEINPLAPWRQLGLSNLADTVEFIFITSYVSSDYTTFELGWKSFFLVASLLMFGGYTFMLYKSAAARDPETGARLPTTLEQKFVWGLALLLVLFNDPTFAAQIFSPTFGATAFYGLSLVTFMALLLLYIAVHFHVAVIQSEAGLARWELDGKTRNLGMLFWVPKIIWTTLFWTLVLSAYMWTRYQQLNDPGYNSGDASSSSSGISDYFKAFMYTLGGIYVAYLFVLIVLAFRYFRRMKTANRYFCILTFSTLVVMLAGLYVNMYTAARATTGAFLAVYGAANFYIWSLCFAYLPDSKLTREEIMARDVAAADTTGVMARGVSGSSGAGKKKKSAARQPTIDEGEEDEEGDLEVNVEDVEGVVQDDDLVTPKQPSRKSSRLTNKANSATAMLPVSTATPAVDAVSFVIEEEDDVAVAAPGSVPS